MSDLRVVGAGLGRTGTHSLELDPDGWRKSASRTIFETFPVTNTAEQFRARSHLEG